MCTFFLSKNLIILDKVIIFVLFYVYSVSNRQDFICKVLLFNQILEFFIFSLLEGTHCTLLCLLSIGNMILQSLGRLRCLSVLWYACYYFSSTLHHCPFYSVVAPIGNLFFVLLLSILTIFTLICFLKFQTLI